jgi:hypothetical protein
MSYVYEMALIVCLHALVLNLLNYVRFVLDTTSRYRTSMIILNRKDQWGLTTT